MSFYPQKNSDGKARMAQPSFRNGEAQFLLRHLVPNRMDDNFQIMLAAERDGPNSRNWHYVESPNPGRFHDSNVRPWGKSQPNNPTTSFCQCTLAMAYLKTWSGRGFHDMGTRVRAPVLCELELD